MGRMHKTKEVKLTIQVDERLADVVNMMNKMTGVRTLESCEGGYLKEIISRAAYMKGVFAQGYVAFYCTNRNSLITISEAFSGANSDVKWGREITIEQVWQVNDDGKLSYTITWIPQKGKAQDEFFKHLKSRFRKALKKVK